MRDPRAGVVVYVDLGIGLEARIVGVFYGLTPLQVIAVLERAGSAWALQLVQGLCRRTVRDLVERYGGPPPAGTRAPEVWETMRGDPRDRDGGPPSPQP